MCLNKPEYALITLNITEYASIYLKKQYMSDAVHSIPMDTSSSIRHRFDIEIPRGKFVEITSILKGESTWKL